MNRYYTLSPDGETLVWHPGKEPVMWNYPERMAGDTWGLQQLFRADEPMIYVPWDVVQILTQ